MTHIGRVRGYPANYEDNVNVSFYVTNPSKSTPVPKKVLASILLFQDSDLENALTQQVALQTSAAPDPPPQASEEQINNSVVILISSFTQNQVCVETKCSKIIIHQANNYNYPRCYLINFISKFGFTKKMRLQWIRQ